MKFQTVIEIDAIQYSGQNDQELVDVVQQVRPRRPLQAERCQDEWLQDQLVIRDSRDNKSVVEVSKGSWLYVNPFSDWPEFYVDSNEQFTEMWTPVVAEVT